MQTRLEVWDRQTTACPDCGGTRVIYTGEAVSGDTTLAVFWAFLYDHPGNPEVYIDATFGTWGIEGQTQDHVTFGARTGAVEEHPHVASSLVTGGEFADDDPRFGAKLTREQALDHPLHDDFWAVNDAILQIDEIQRLLAGRPRRRRWPWRRS